MGAPRAPVLQACQELRDLPRRSDVPPRAARAAHRHLSAELTLASYNAHWGVGRFGAQHGRRFDVAEIVRGFDADVVVVPEAWRELDGRGVLDELTDDGYRIEILPFATFEYTDLVPETLMPGEGTWELAVCSRLPITARSTVPIGTVANDVAGARRALVCTVDVGGAPLDIVAVHVSSKIWKLAPVHHLRGLREQLPPVGRTAVVAGDCNLWGPAVVSLFPGWRRAVLGRTYPARRPHSQIDHVLVRDDVTVVAGEVLPLTPSDHRPVRARLRLNGV